MLSSFHFSFTVTNLERSLAFYQETLGLELVGVMDRVGEDISRIVGFPDAFLKIAFLKLPGCDLSLELIEYVSPKGQLVDTRAFNPGNSHICFKVEDIHSAYTELREKGVRFKSEPVEVLTGMGKGRKAVYFSDPDGINLELVQFPKSQGS